MCNASLSVIKQHNTKTSIFGSAKLKFLVFSASVFVRGEISDSRSGRFTLTKIFRYALDRGWFVLGILLEIVGYGKIHSQSVEIIQSLVLSSLSSRYTTWTTTFLPFNLYSSVSQPFRSSRYPWPRSSYLTAPLEENIYFFKLIYFLIISYLRDITVYCCWVSICSLINYAKMNVI